MHICIVNDDIMLITKKLYNDKNSTNMYKKAPKLLQNECSGQHAECHCVAP